MANIGDYATTYANFEWEMPESFNFGRDVVDRWAEDDRSAMIWLGANGDERRLSFGDFSRLPTSSPTRLERWASNAATG